ncbi:MAG: zinc metallopeptidase [Oscillospiraceae bacterium]
MDFYFSYLIIIPALIFAFYAQMKVKSTFDKYSAVYNRRGLRAEDAARQILDENGLTNVRIERVSGNLTDHYDPRTNVVALSNSVYGSTSVSAIGVAAHEVGHAIQHAEGYTPIVIRNAILPVVNIGSNLAVPLVIAGFIFSFQPLVTFGIFLYAGIVLFQAITLPVELNASSRAIKTLENYNMLDVDELKNSRSVLTAAAMTYVAALLSALLSLLRLIFISRRRD